MGSLLIAFLVWLEDFSWTEKRPIKDALLAGIFPALLSLLSYGLYTGEQMTGNVAFGLASIVVFVVLIVGSVPWAFAAMFYCDVRRSRA